MGAFIVAKHEWNFDSRNMPSVPLWSLSWYRKPHSNPDTNLRCNIFLLSPFGSICSARQAWHLNDPSWSESRIHICPFFYFQKRCTFRRVGSPNGLLGSQIGLAVSPNGLLGSQNGLVGSEAYIRISPCGTLQDAEDNDNHSCLWWRVLNPEIYCSCENFTNISLLTNQ